MGGTEKAGVQCGLRSREVSTERVGLEGRVKSPGQENITSQSRENELRGHEKDVPFQISFLTSSSGSIHFK